ncbi:hypothetical protein CHCC20335_2018 [Bacillus paralicheniformis]|nr:hypothetical protein CHCC20335_2018 [Bacillus paralicheniformis]GIN66594.1 hypothetical protein J41TS2_20150 [Bacillus sonorensis]
MRLFFMQKNQGGEEMLDIAMWAIVVCLAAVMLLLLKWAGKTIS